MRIHRLFSLFIIVTAILGGSFFATAQTENEAKKEATKGGPDVSQIIFGHIADSHEWHFFNIPHEGGKPTEVAFPLPCIVYHPTKGLMVFSSSKIKEEEYEGLRLNEVNLKNGALKERIVAVDGTPVKDFSITKNVLSMLISIVLLLWVMLAVAKKYKKNGDMVAPSGMQNFLEVVIVFLREEVAKPNLGHKWKRYFPLLLTIFFFIWINNLLGLLPGGANFTGNIAVTGCLAFLAFVVILASSNKHFWGHLFNPPNVPLGIKFLLVPIEIISLFIKPMALMIRLFANIMAGHIVILSLICMIFIFAFISKIAGTGFVVVSVGFSIVMFMLELLVGAIQAFIFANLTAVFIGQAIEGDHSHEPDHTTGQDYQISENEIIA